MEQTLLVSLRMPLWSRAGYEAALSLSEIDLRLHIEQAGPLLAGEQLELTQRPKLALLPGAFDPGFAGSLARVWALCPAALACCGRPCPVTGSFCVKQQGGCSL